MDDVRDERAQNLINELRRGTLVLAVLKAGDRIRLRFGGPRPVLSPCTISPGRLFTTMM